MPSQDSFDIVLRGYDREQVQHYVRAVEATFALLSAVREAAGSRTEDLVKQLAVLRTENRELSTRIDRICRTPIEPDGLTERMILIVELANEEATDLISRAETANRQAEERRQELDEMAAQRRQQAEKELEIALSARRTEANEVMAEQEAKAASLVHEATKEATQIIANARRQAEVVQQLRGRVGHLLATADRLLAESAPPQ